MKLDILIGIYPLIKVIKCLDFIQKVLLKNPYKNVIKMSGFFDVFITVNILPSVL